MLFAQHNGLEHALGDTSEVEVLQNLACGIGPRVDGINASRSIPQAMGAYVTAGAQGACIGRDQQNEQHTSTTGHGLGLGWAITPSVSPSGPPPGVTCGTGTQWDPVKGSCECPTGQTWNAATQACSQPTLTKLQTRLMLAPSIMAMQQQPLLNTQQQQTQQTQQQQQQQQQQQTQMQMQLLAYPVGTITAFSAKTGKWRIATPRGTAGLGIFSAAADFVEVPSADAPPSTATQVPENELLAKTGQLPFYKNYKSPLFWAAIAGSVVVVGTGSYFLLRRRKSV